MAAPGQQAMGGLNQMMGGATAAAGAAMGKAQEVVNKMFAPDKVQMNMGGILLSAGDRYVLNPFGKDSPGCCDVFCLIIGCASKHLLYFTLDGKLTDVHNPGNCCCRKPWQVTTWKRGSEGSKKVVSKVLIDKMKCCSSANGFAFSCCGSMCCLPACQCSGHLKHMWVTDESKKNDKGQAMEKYTILQELVFCWVIGYTCAGLCTPMGNSIAGIKACCNLCNGRILRETIQPIFGPQADRAQLPNRVGSVGMMHMMCPVSCCCAQPCQTVKYKFQTKDNQPMDDDALASAALLLAMYKGMGAADTFIPDRPKFPQPLGIPCADMGLHAEVRYVNVMDAMKEGVFDM